MRCPAGTYLLSPGPGCGPCPMDSFCRPAANTPQPCPGVLVTARTGVRSLAGCVNPPGFRYVPGSAQPSARPCEINTYSPGLAGQTSCTPCPPGTATDPEAPIGKQTNSSSCRAPPGFFHTGDGVSPCAVGSFKAGYSGLCVSCPVL
uniref:Tyrosine-protein kinase ephrin type A/B receptor-like domain-containing protein n=1 Tax=Tetradesmus obliquus TaxID=3088 RepID=A0A383VSK4_TETOB|eukprot:jgi/Sobl393_1/10493/SZX68161.1